MDCKRDRFIDFIKSQGIEVNISKNKARGNKGLFKVVCNRPRIDISKSVGENEFLRVLIHEFAHYIHYSYDKKMKNIDFFLSEVSPEIMEEFILITVEEVDKTNATQILNKKTKLKFEIDDLVKQMKQFDAEFRLSKPYLPAEKYLKRTNFRHLLKYDRVKVFEGFRYKLYSIEEIDKYNLPKDVKLYLQIKSKQRYIKRINGKINRLNKYYNNVSELFARSVVSYVFDKQKFSEVAPSLCNVYDEVIINRSVPLLNDMISILKK